ncbi:2-C-methyl-D-erythritol 4-phosphate cytidylyltransferase [Dethiosulfatibacter aminovorans]|nr:2-C-methyl-D-erythritol 4-phosphate cytidylyltransferase [Dethiosulfatibacter aminovorans]
MKKIAVVIAAAGSGTRMSAKVKKQYMLLDGKPILYHTIKKFDGIEEICNITVVCDFNGMDFLKKEILEKNCFEKSVNVVEGGASRTESVMKGLLSLDTDTDFVLIHDGVRPFINRYVIREAIKQTVAGKSVVVCSKTVDTIKVAEKGRIIKTLDRSVLWNAETPQCFKYGLILEKVKEAMDLDEQFTDEASILEYFGMDVHIVENSHPNIKITMPKDLVYGEYLLKEEE